MKKANKTTTKKESESKIKNFPKRFKVISVHYGTQCTRIERCKNCYGCDNSSVDKPKDKKFFIDMIPYLAKLTHQVTIGSYGEPLLYSDFVLEFAHECKVNRLICNMTTNGDVITAIRLGKMDNKVKEKELKLALNFLTMLSLSFNDNLIKDNADFVNFKLNVKWLQENYPRLLIGVNYLVSDRDFNIENKVLDKQSKFALDYTGGITFYSNVKMLIDTKYGICVDNVYALHPKNYALSKRLPIWMYNVLTNEYPNFYVDDLTRKIIIDETSYTEVYRQGLNKFKTECHYGRGVISITPSGNVCGCSFEKKPIAKLNKPKDILRFKSLRINKRYSCPFLRIAKGAYDNKGGIIY